MVVNRCFIVDFGGDGSREKEVAGMKKNTGIEAQARIVETVGAMLEPVVADLGLELVEVQFRPEAGGWVLRLFIDSAAGVSLDDCAKVSREVGDLLDVEEFIGHAYHLEVSSPGLDRALRKMSDYARCKGRKAKVTTREAIGRHGSSVIGVIEAADGDGVVLAVDGEKVSIPFALIARAKLVVEF